MMQNAKSAVMDLPTSKQAEPVSTSKAYWKNPSTISTVSTAALSAGLLFLSPELGIGAAVGGVALGAISAGISLSRRRAKVAEAVRVAQVTPQKRRRKR